MFVLKQKYKITKQKTGQNIVIWVVTIYSVKNRKREVKTYSET